MSTSGPFASDSGTSSVVADFFSDLFGEGGLDAVWLDLDGDEVPDIQISAYDAQGVEPSADDLFDVSDQASADDSSSYDASSADASSYDASSYDAADGAGVDSWISIPTEADGAPVYDVWELIPDQSVPYADWTDPGAQGYDPLAMSNFSVDAGPVVIDPASGDPYCATDYTSTDLWYNAVPFDDGAGYWDPTYAVMPAQLDTSMWQMAPETYAPASYADPSAFQPYADPFATYSDPAAYSDTSMFAYDGSSAYSLPGYDSTDFTSWSSATDDSMSYFTDTTFDDQLSTAYDNSQYWMTEYDDASSLSNDFWQMSVDASTAGDGVAAYDYNQLSLDASSYADDAWSYSSSAWDSVSTDSSWDSSSYDY